MWPVTQIAARVAFINQNEDNWMVGPYRGDDILSKISRKQHHPRMKPKWNDTNLNISNVQLNLHTKQRQFSQSRWKWLLQPDIVFKTRGKVARIFLLKRKTHPHTHTFQLKQACVGAAKQLCYSIPLEWTMQRHATMQLTGIKTTGKMTDYTRMEVCACMCEQPCTFKNNKKPPTIWIFSQHMYLNIKQAEQRNVVGVCAAALYLSVFASCSYCMMYGSVLDACVTVGSH